MHAARRNDQCILGVAKARQEIWKYVGPWTIVIGHGVRSDLESLRWIHPIIIDSYIIEKALKEEEELRNHIPIDISMRFTEEELQEMKKQKEAEKRESGGPLSLKKLAKTRLGRDIQDKSRLGHDSLEDAIATRDLVHWHVVKAMAKPLTQQKPESAPVETRGTPVVAAEW